MEMPNPVAEQAAQSFFTEEGRVLSDIAGGSRFTFKRGEGWAIDPESGSATYDPKFFEERGYTPSQALFGAFHELKAHLVETVDLLDIPGGNEAHQQFKDRSKDKQRLHIWENCRTDIKGNQAILGFAPSLATDVETLYREKLWPETNLTDKPRHLQFMYAILRTSMVPGQQVQVDPEVSAAINKLRNIKGKDVIALATDPTLAPLSALKLSEKYIEPEIEKLYQQDLQDKKGEQQPGQGQGQGQAGSGEPFEGNYDDYKNRHPKPWDENEVDEKVQEVQKSQSAGARQAAGYEAEHGVSKKDVADYLQEYHQVEKHIEPLRAVFRRIVEQRKIPIRHLAALKEEGVMIDPGLVAQTYMDVKAGVPNPRTMKDFEGLLIDENIPGKFSIRLVADQSSSMGGEKATAQRRAAIVVMESLKEFSNIVDEQRAGLSVDLDVQTELRSFGVKEGTRLYKPLSKELTEKQRVEYFKGLMETKGGTNDYDTLSEIEKDVRARIASDANYAAELRSGKRREIVIVLSDGDSGNVSEAKGRIKNLRDLGVKIVGLGMTGASTGIVNTYAPDGRVCYDVGNLPKTLEEMLTEYLVSLSIDGNPQTLLNLLQEV